MSDPHWLASSFYRLLFSKRTGVVLFVKNCKELPGRLSQRKMLHPKQPRCRFEEGFEFDAITRWSFHPCRSWPMVCRSFEGVLFLSSPLDFHVRSTTPVLWQWIACVQTCSKTIGSKHTQRFDHFSCTKRRFRPTLYHPSSKTRVLLMRFLPFLVRKETSRVPRFV